MKTECHTKEVENKTDKNETMDSCPKITDRDILEANDILLEEVAIDGICGVY